MMLAFPKASGERQLVYARLPVCSSGFNFAIDADWDLVSSRQSVREDSQWNLWLRGLAATLFAEVCAN